MTICGRSPFTAVDRHVAASSRSLVAAAVEIAHSQGRATADPRNAERLARGVAIVLRRMAGELAREIALKKTQERK